MTKVVQTISLLGIMSAIPFEVSLGTFEAQARPVSIGEYVTYLVKTSQKDRLPITWTFQTEKYDKKIILFL